MQAEVKQLEGQTTPQHPTTLEIATYSVSGMRGSIASHKAQLIKLEEAQELALQGQASTFLLEILHQKHGNKYLRYRKQNKERGSREME